MLVGSHILRTTDQGARWTVSADPVGRAAGLDVLDAMDVWVYGPSGLGRTTDGGLRWARTSKAWVTMTDFASASTGVAVFNSGGSGVLERTDSGGKSWSMIYGARPVLASCLPSPNSAWMVTQDGPDRMGVEGSTDGGATWTASFEIPLNGGLGPPVAEAQCVGGRVWILASSGAGMSQESYTLYRKSGTGRSWRAVLSASSAGGGPAPGAANSGLPVASSDSVLAFLAPTPQNPMLLNVCSACGAGTLTLQASADGGATWHSATPPLGTHIVPDIQGGQVAAFISPRTGWMLATELAAKGAKPVLLHTTDGGASWTVLRAAVASSKPS